MIWTAPTCSVAGRAIGEVDVYKVTCSEAVMSEITTIGIDLAKSVLSVPSALESIRVNSWTAPASAAVTGAAEALEQGRVLYLPDLAFPIDSEDASVFSPLILSSSKNASFDPASQKVGGTTLTGDELVRLRRLISRFSDATEALLNQLLPEYRGRPQRARASFRPAEIEGRSASWRKDDTRLHVDSFPSSPTNGRRILRVFCNVNPVGRSRSWRIGESFESVAKRFAQSLSMPLAGSATVYRLLHVTKTTRSAYDALMLKLHDSMKADRSYQQTVPQTAFDFPAGSTWLAFTDQVSHAAMAGQYQLEQTFLLPVNAMIDETRSPLRVLERIKERRLA